MKSLAIASCLLLISGLRAAEVAYAPPLGGMTVAIAGGTSVAPTTTWFAIPLLDQPVAAGVKRGRISAVTANTLTVADAGWTVGALSNSAYPYAVRITSGAGEGATLDVVANTADTVTLSESSLLGLGVVSGDSCQLVPVDTLNTLFGANTFVGGANADAADNVIIASSIELTFYYNTTLGRWVRTTGPTTDRGSIPMPISGVMAVIRKSAGLDLRFVGQVPVTKFRQPVANAGTTYTHTGFPTEVTLGGFNLPAMLPGWVTSSTAANADVLSVNSGGLWFSYFHNGTNWQRTTGPATNRNGVQISAGTPIQIFKIGSASGTSDFTRQLPYSL